MFVTQCCMMSQRRCRKIRPGRVPRRFKQSSTKRWLKIRAIVTRESRTSLTISVRSFVNSVLIHFPASTIATRQSRRNI